MTATVEEGAVGRGGSFNITTGLLSLTNVSGLSTSTLGQGDGGSVNILAHDTVSLDGESTVFSTVEEGAVGSSGGINITTESLFVTNGAQLQALTRGQGNAGNVNINARDTVSFDGVSSSDEGQSGVFSGVDKEAMGNGSGINIATKLLYVNNSARLSATSEGKGAAGNIEVAADSIRLDNQARLRADTTGEQGNIFLRSGDLVLRRGSNITTDATGTATGGNITIDTDVLAALENSDITANASEGPGGQVIIDASGIFGTQFRTQRTPQSDITATSNLGPQFSGTIEINTPDIDPNQGLVNLPAQLVDASGLIASSCGAGGRQGESEFIVTGRGGLPPTPSDTLSALAVLADWATLPHKAGPEEGAGGDGGDFEAPPSPPASPASPPLIVEAQGWMTNDKGEVVLTASTPVVTPHNPWIPSATCHTPKTSS